MPFKSVKQARWMFKNKPRMARRWAGEMSRRDWKRLPKRAGKKGTRK